MVDSEVYDCIVDILNKVEEYEDDADAFYSPMDVISNKKQPPADLTLPSFRQVATTRNLPKFFKGCSWSPDGLCIMANNDDNYIRLYNTPQEFISKDWNFDNELIPSLKIKESSTIYDYCWWPAMNSMYPSTCCLLTTCKDQPTHLWDAFDGTLRGSYIAKNPVDDVIAANSLSFSPDGMQLLCGYKKEVRLFYTDSPGTKCELWKTDKQKNSAQSGIISNITFHPDGSMFALACYNKTIGIYSTNNGHLLDLYKGHVGGVTFIKFSNDGNRLYSGGRCDGEIKCWDIRHSVNLCNFGRTVTTNQRIQFDFYNVDSVEKYLCSGNTNGNLNVWNIECFSNESELNCPKTEQQLHNDCLNGVSAHPYLPILATTSGQRHNDYDLHSENDSTDEDIIIENTMKFWKINNEILT